MDASTSGVQGVWPAGELGVISQRRPPWPTSLRARKPLSRSSPAAHKGLNASRVPWDKGTETRRLSPTCAALWGGLPSPSPAGADPELAPPLNYSGRVAPRLGVVRTSTFRPSS